MHNVKVELVDNIVHLSDPIKLVLGDTFTVQDSRNKYNQLIYRELNGASLNKKFIVDRTKGRLVPMPVLRQFKPMEAPVKSKILAVMFADWYYCDYDNDRIGYYQDIDELVTVVNRYLILTYGVQLDKEEFCMEF